MKEYKIIIDNNPSTPLKAAKLAIEGLWPEEIQMHGDDALIDSKWILVHDVNLISISLLEAYPYKFVCTDRLDYLIYEGCELSVQSIKTPIKVYNIDGVLYFRPYDKEEAVHTYFSNDLEIVQTENWKRKETISCSKELQLQLLDKLKNGCDFINDDDIELSITLLGENGTHSKSIAYPVRERGITITNKNHTYLDIRAMDLLKNRWSHLYTFGYPKKPYPTNYENDLNLVKLGMRGSTTQRKPDKEIKDSIDQFVETNYRSSTEDIRSSMKLAIYDFLNSGL